MKITYSKIIPGVVFIDPEKTFEDHRGLYREIYNLKEYKEKGLYQHFVQDDISVSSRNVLRGIHGDDETYKLISCLLGKIFLVVVNPTDKKWESYFLSAINGWQVLIPPGLGNGHLVISNIAIFHYKQSTYYKPEKQFTIKWNDPDYGIWWPIKEPALSRRDDAGHWVEK